MKQILLFFTLISFLSGWASEPVGSASNITITATDGGQFTFNFTKGGGSARLIVIKEGSKVISTPTDGVVYNTNTGNQYDAKFGMAGMEFNDETGAYVVFRGTPTTIMVKNLKPATTYYIAIFEYNTDGTPNPDYLLATPEASVTTLAAPTVQGTITGFTSAGDGAAQIGGSSLRVNWTIGNGAARIIVAKKGSSLTATPVDLQSYSHNTGFGTQTGTSFILEAGTFVVYNITNASTKYADITNLEPNTTYTFAIFEYNGSTTPVYLKPTVTKTVTTNAGPTKQSSSSFTFSSIDGNKLGFYWSTGNGSKRLVIAKKGSAVTSVPVNGNAYTAKPEFGLGQEIVPGSGEYVVYNGSANSLTVTNLEKLTEYHFVVYEYDIDINGYAYYLTSTTPVAPARTNKSTAVAPTGQTTISVSNITGNAATLTYSFPASGAGSYRILVIRDGAPVDFVPEDLKYYNNFTDTYGTGTPVGTNTYILFGQSNGGAPIVKGLTTGHTYYVTVFEMNGKDAPVYKVPGSSAVIAVPNEPTTGSTNPNFVTVEGNHIRFDWATGTGAKRIVVVRKGAPVSNVPQDGTTYTAAAKFGNGSELVNGSGEFVVYNDQNQTVTITGLEKATTYYFAVFEYNQGPAGPDYLTTATKYLATSKATISAPTSQTNNLNVSGILSDRATINFSVGNGSSRIFVMHEGGPVDAEPTDYSFYSENAIFGLGGAIGTNNYVVGKSKTSSFTVTGLKAGTEYYITAFEFNGSSAPVYLRPGATSYSFTTTGGVVIPTPAQASHTPAPESIDGNKFTFKWTSGDGANRIVVARKGGPVSFTPTNGQEYAANAAFGEGLDLSSGQYVVYKGNGNLVNLTKLEPSTVYHFAVFEYNGSTTTTKYLISTFLAASQSSAIAPTNAASVAGTTFTTNTITFNWNKGNGNGRLVIMKEGGEVTTAPANLSVYSFNTDFKNAPQLAAGEYIVYTGTGNTVAVSGITTGRTYHFAVYEYNGATAPVYNTTTFMKAAVATTPLPVNWVAFSATSMGNKVRLDWVTAQEVNNRGFEIERSSDGIVFIKIGEVVPNSVFVYQYVDVQPLPITAYYRIRQLDIDGQTSYSKTVRVQGNTNASDIRLLQNPVQNQLKLQSPQHFIGGYLQIINSEGKVLSSQKLSASLQVIDVQALQKGVYYLKILNKEGMREVVLTFIKN